MRQARAPRHAAVPAAARDTSLCAYAPGFADVPVFGLKAAKSVLRASRAIEPHAQQQVGALEKVGVEHDARADLRESEA